MQYEMHMKCNMNLCIMNYILNKTVFYKIKKLKGCLYDCHPQ